MNVEPHFEGPYSWFRGDLPSVLEKDETTTRPGIYIWTADTSQGEPVYCVGETGRSFRQRFKEHLIEQASGWYHIHDPDSFRDGRRKAVWPGLYEVKEERLSRWEEYLQRLPELATPLKSVSGSCDSISHRWIVIKDLDGESRQGSRSTCTHRMVSSVIFENPAFATGLRTLETRRYQLQ